METLTLELIENYVKIDTLISEQVEKIWECGKKYKVFGGDIESFKCYIESKEVNIDYYETWAYGGYDRGDETIPLSILLGSEDVWNEYFESIVKKREDNKKEKERQSKEEAEKNERSLFEKLKEKYS